MAFYSVVKRIHKGEVEDRTTFRGVLYDVFGFGPDAYLVGMDCNYMEIHNLLYGAVSNGSAYVVDTDNGTKNNE
jgi:hypothetical protein